MLRFLYETQLYDAISKSGKMLRICRELEEFEYSRNGIVVGHRLMMNLRRVLRLDL